MPPRGDVNPRPEIVLPPGFALRIDYDPESSPASLLITAYRDDAPVGQAHLDPRAVGQRLRLEVDDDDAAAPTHAPRLRLTPQRAMRAIVMGEVRDRAPLHGHSIPPELPEAHPAIAALHELAREGALDASSEYDANAPRRTSSLVWLINGNAVVLPDEADAAERPWSRVQRAVRALSGAAADLLWNPLRLRDAESEWPSWRATWRVAHQPSGASES